MGGQGLRRKIAQVARHQNIGTTGNGRGQHMRIRRVGQVKPLLQTVLGHDLGPRKGCRQRRDGRARIVTAPARRMGPFREDPWRPKRHKFAASATPPG